MTAGAMTGAMIERLQCPGCTIGSNMACGSYKEITPNLAPADVRDAFRDFMRTRDRAGRTS